MADRQAVIGIEMLMRVHARCVVGLEDIWITRMDATLRPTDGEPKTSTGEPRRRAEDSSEEE